jgi:tyrosyl-tRNA synthetase
MERVDKIDLLKRNVAEIVKEEELIQLLEEKKTPTVYTGYEPSGKIHLGHLLTINKLIDFKDAGFKVIVLLADLNAYLNEKGSLDEIEEIAKMNKRYFEAFGLKAEYVFGSDFQLDPEYTKNVLRLSRNTTLKRARRSMDEVGRNMESPRVSQMIYPLMQVMDIAELGVDVAMGGTDQRKIHMLAREESESLGFKKPICVHMPIIVGLDGEKMSSSKNNFIAMDDSSEDIYRKITSSFCPPREIEGNPIIHLYRYHIFQRYERLSIERAEKYGGNLEYSSCKGLEEDYLNGKIHPMDLKKNAARYVDEILSPIRQVI